MYMCVCVCVCVCVCFPGGSVVKNLPANAGDGDWEFSPGVGKIPWRRKWQPTPVFLPGEFHGQSKLMCYSPWDQKESDTTSWLNNTNYCIYMYVYIYIDSFSHSFSLSIIFELRPLHAGQWTQGINIYLTQQLCVDECRWPEGLYEETEVWEVKELASPQVTQIEPGMLRTRIQLGLKCHPKLRPTIRRLSSYRCLKRFVLWSP